MNTISIRRGIRQFFFGAALTEGVKDFLLGNFEKDLDAAEAGLDKALEDAERALRDVQALETRLKSLRKQASLNGN